MDSILESEILTQKVIIPVLYVIISFFIWYLLIISKGQSEKENNARNIILMRLSGMILFGIIPVLFIAGSPYHKLSMYGINGNNLAGSAMWAVILGTLLILINFALSRKPGKIKNYPQIHTDSWTSNLIFTNIVTWIGYILAYEFLFRGFLLFPLVDQTGVIPAILINTVLYSGSHFHKGTGEVLGSIPLGIILCLLTIKYGNIWIAFLTHLSLALSIEYFICMSERKNFESSKN